MAGTTGGEQSGEELDLSGEQFGGHLICGGKPLTFLARGGADKICAGKWGLVRRRERMCVCVCGERTGCQGMKVRRRLLLPVCL